MDVLPKDKEEGRMSRLSVHLPTPSAWLFLSRVIIIKGHVRHTLTCSTRVEVWHDTQPCLVGLIGMRPGGVPTVLFRHVQPGIDE
jgi:hypothetical protein